MRVAVIGTGTWGSAAAMLVARQQQALLFGRDPDKVAHLASGGEHPQLRSFRLPAALTVTSRPEDLSQAELLLWAVPTQHCRGMARWLEPHLAANACIVSLAKGLERQTLLRPTEILCQELGDGRCYGVLSGPSHAEEVLHGLPTGLVAAGTNSSTTAGLQELLHHAGIRIYTSHDMLGVELGGALKNVIAVAAGMCDGAQVGDNAKATLITRGLAEIRRLGRAMGADDATLAGLAGIGDLLTTCYSDHGRNRALGLAIGRGISAEEHINASNMIAEGAYTAAAACQLGDRHGCELPIAMAVDAIVWHGKPWREAMAELLNRGPKEENP